MPRTAATGPLAEVELSVPSMVCEGCAEKISQALMSIPGVNGVKPKLWRKRVHVRYEASKLEASQIKNALAVAGYRAVD